MGTIVITSRLGEEFREDLEQILFFNPEQHKAIVDIEHCVKHYGVPEITNVNGYLRINLNSYSVAQTLYSIDRGENGDTLAGVIVFVRNTHEDISVLFVAIAKNYILRGSITTARLVWDLVHQIIESAARISGVRNVKLACVSSAGKKRAAITCVPINKRTRKHTVTKFQSGSCPDETITCYEYQRCFNCANKGAVKTRKSL